MIVFDRFLCCIKLKSFGKVLGWSGTMICVISAYAVFLIASGRKTAGENAANHMIFGKDLSVEDFYYYAALVIVLLLLIAVFHVMLLFGIKYLKSILIVPYILLSVFLIASMVCLLPSEIHLFETNIYLIIGCITGLIFGVYFALCVYSLYGQVRYEEKRRKLYRNGDTIFIAPLPL